MMSSSRATPLMKFCLDLIKTMFAVSSKKLTSSKLSASFRHRKLPSESRL